MLRMERENNGSLLACILLLGLACQSFIAPALSRKLEDSTLKPDCDCPTPTHKGGPSTPTPSHGGSGHPAPSTPSHGGGGYYPSPSGNSPPAIVNPPSIPVTPTPHIPSPVTPVTPTPSTPDPRGPPYSPGSCSYWISHPGAVWAIFGYWSTIAKSFGAASGTAMGKNISLLDALNNTRTDGVGALYREGSAALLNSVAYKKYPLTTQQVKDAFAAAVDSDKAAEAQAEIFKQANEGGDKHT